MTEENAKKRLEVWLKCMDCPEDKQCYDSYLHSTCEYTDYCDETPISEAVKVAIKALEQESILDKIRAEVCDIDDNIVLNPNSLYESKVYVRLIEVLDIIDKHKAESEGEHG